METSLHEFEFTKIDPVHKETVETLINQSEGIDVSNNSVIQDNYLNTSGVIISDEVRADSVQGFDRLYEADEESDSESDIESDHGKDSVFEEIEERLSRQFEEESVASLPSHLSSQSDEPVVKVSDHFTSISYGIQPRATYNHGRKNPDIMGVSYNGRMRQFIILDAKGVTTWKRDAVEARVNHALSYPKYEYKLITHLVYAKKHNCYFALAKDFTLKVMNRDFVETCSVSADLNSILFMLFNPVRDELLTGGVGGTKVWHFHQVATKAFMELKPLANYRLTLRYELPNIGGRWVKRVDLDFNLNHIYCCSDTDLHAYDMEGRLLFTFKKAHTMTITGCQYSVASRVLVTASVDAEVKVWSLFGGLVHTFRGHSRAVTHLLIHPDTSSIAITSSLDGTVRMWSLDTMEALYSLVVSTEGVLWMGLTDDNLLYVSTTRNIILWSLNYFCKFWSLARNKVNSLSLVGSAGKTTRIMALGDDSSVRLFARSNQKNMSTVLPPPSISPLQQVLSVCYSREFNVVFMLINPHEIWVYTTRTDPACRIAVWNILDIQYAYFLKRTRQEQDTTPNIRPGSRSSATVLHGGQATHRATESGIGNEEITKCRCLSTLTASVMMWTEEGFCCPIRHSYLLLGMEDGRILFMDPVVKGQKYMEFKASKDAIEEVQHDKHHNSLLTLCTLKELNLIQIWSLPDLALLHEVFCDKDLTKYARINSSFLTGHESGCVNLHPLVPAEDLGIFKAKVVSSYSVVVDTEKRPEHNEAIIALDACQTVKIFCSCSDDGAIKIWDEFRVLLTEIKLDSSLSAACFLNDMGDMVVGFKQHMFYIDHTKIAPHLTVPETELDTFDQESFVYEDLAVLYEGVISNPDPITLATYLVPYEIEFSKDFLEGKLQLDPAKIKKPTPSDEESDLSMAPTDIYLSPPETPKPLSRIDLTLETEITRYDLLTQMEKTLQYLMERAQLKRDQKGRKSVEEITPGLSGDESATDDQELRDITQFDFPRFGISPGPTPSGSTRSTPESLSTIQVSEEEESEEEKAAIKEAETKAKQEAKLQAMVNARLAEIMPPPPPVPQRRRKDTWSQNLEAFVPKLRRRRSKLVAAPIVKDQKSQLQGLTFEPMSKISLGDMKVDIKGLLKEKRKVVQLQKEADHSHVKSEATEYSEKKRDKPRREIKKKKLVNLHKMDRKSQKGPLSLHKTAVEMMSDASELQTLAKNEELGDNSGTQVITGTDEDQLESQLGQESVKHEEPSSMGIDASELLKDSVAESVPDLPSLPDITEKQSQIRRPKSSKLRRNMVFMGETGSSLSTGEKTLSESATAESDILTQAQQSTVSGRASSQMRTTSEEPFSMSVDMSFSNHFIPKSPQTPEMPDYVTYGPPPTPRTPVNFIDNGTVKSAPEKVYLEPLNVFLPQDFAEDEWTDTKSDTGGYESGLDSELISVSQRDGFPDSGPEFGNRDESRDVAGPLLTGQERDKLKQRPKSSFIDRTDQEKDSRWKRTRPHTAVMYNYAAEDLQAAFNAALQRYQSIPGTPLSADKLYRNDGLYFDEKWHDRAIERHMLLRMQKELRHQNAAQKRQLLSQRQRERQQSLFGHSECGSGMADGRPMTSGYVLQQLERANTIPAVSARPATTLNSTLQQRQRPQTANLGLLREQHQQRTPRKDKSTLSRAETPFRLRMSPVPTRLIPGVWSDVRETSETPRIDPQLLNPRNPYALRPKSSCSIPSKCSRYILVSREKDKTQAPIPSPLEEQLLFERFPNDGMKMLNTLDGSFPRPRKPTYGIEYSPYAQPI